MGREHYSHRKGIEIFIVEIDVTYIRYTLFIVTVNVYLYGTDIVILCSHVKSDLRRFRAANNENDFMVDTYLLLRFEKFAFVCRFCVT